VLTEALKAAMV